MSKNWIRIIRENSKGRNIWVVIRAAYVYKIAIANKSKQRIPNSQRTILSILYIIALFDTNKVKVISYYNSIYWLFRYIWVFIYNYIYFIIYLQYFMYLLGIYFIHLCFIINFSNFHFINYLCIYYAINRHALCDSRFNFFGKLFFLYDAMKESEKFQHYV